MHTYVSYHDNVFMLQIIIELNFILKGIMIKINFRFIKNTKNVYMKHNITYDREVMILVTFVFMFII